jgi:DNA repair exonuclease SbcCD nuclease subunit
MIRVGIIGDLHCKDLLGYADYVSDKRIPERQAVLDQIANLFKGYDLVVLMGDNFNARNNSSETIKDFVKFAQSIRAPLAIIAGNHEKAGSGKSALDFVEELDNDWATAIRGPKMIDVKGVHVVLLPYMSRTEMKCQDNRAAGKAIQGILPEGDILLAHQAFTGYSFGGTNTDDINEPVLDKAWLAERYQKVAIGHIHQGGNDGKFLVAGSVFCNEVGEEEKSVWTLLVDETTRKTEVVAHILDQRGIRKIKDPEPKDIENLTPADWIVKAEITKRGTDVEAVKRMLRPFAGSVVVERYPNERMTIKTDSDVLDYSVENMLAMYAKAKNLNPDILLTGYALIRK